MKKQILTSVLGLIALTLISSKVLGQGECPGQLCIDKAAVIDQICKELENKGEPVFIENNGSYCWCKCSGKTVLAFGKNGQWQPVKAVNSKESSKPQQSLPYVIYLATENDVTLIVKPEHLFLMASGEFKRADRLIPEDILLDENREELSITTLTRGDYMGSFQPTTIQGNKENPQKEEHLVETYGVLSGDYFASIFMQPQSSKDLPQIGTLEYYTKYGLSKDLGLIGLRDTISFKEEFKFIPYKEEEVPKGATRLIPAGLDTAKENMLLPLNNLVPNQMAIDLLKRFKLHYPGINFVIAWNNPIANAWADIWQGRPRVKVAGALIRHRYIKIEGLSLAIAHEVGHHLGGPPRKPDNPLSSCEGQADYWGALIAMRKIWPGQSAVESIDKGSNQLYNLFEYGLKENLFKVDMALYGNGGGNTKCTRPEALCRLETYRAAMRADPKPACAAR